MRFRWMAIKSRSGRKKRWNLTVRKAMGSRGLEEHQEFRQAHIQHLRFQTTQDWLSYESRGLALRSEGGT